MFCVKHMWIQAYANCSAYSLITIHLYVHNWRSERSLLTQWIIWYFSTQVVCAMLQDKRKLLLYDCINNTWLKKSLYYHPLKGMVDVILITLIADINLRVAGDKGSSTSINWSRLVNVGPFKNQFIFFFCQIHESIYSFIFQT